MARAISFDDLVGKLETGLLLERQAGRLVLDNARYLLALSHDSRWQAAGAGRFSDFVKERFGLGPSKLQRYLLVGTELSEADLAADGVFLSAAHRLALKKKRLREPAPVRQRTLEDEIKGLSGDLSRVRNRVERILKRPGMTPERLRELLPEVAGLLPAEPRRCIGELRQLLGLDGAAAAEDDGQAKKQHWHRDTPAQARAAADTIEDAARFFPGLRAAEMRKREERVRRDGALLLELGALWRDFQRGLLVNRSRLFRDTKLVIDTARGTLALPLLAAPDRQDLTEASRNLLLLVDRRAQARLKAGEKNRKLLEEAAAEVTPLQAETERLRRENQVLRGAAI